MSDLPSTIRGAWGEPRLLNCLEEERLWVYLKPAGWLSHPDGSGRPDLITWAQERGQAPEGLSLIHRLDFGTSGLLCCALGAEAAARWGAAWAEGRVKKRYLALAEGKLNAKGVISRPLKDGRRGRPLKAKTRYRRLLALKGCALLDLQIEQGRKHQIRRHLQGVGSGVVGDRRYPPHKRSPLKGAPDRLWLHAASLSLPIKGSSLTLRAPLAPELYDHLRSLCEAEALDSLRSSLG